MDFGIQLERKSNFQNIDIPDELAIRGSSHDGVHRDQSSINKSTLLNQLQRLQ